MLTKELFIVIIALTSFSNAANILYLATVTSRSHTIWHRPLIHALAARGHNVTVVAVDVEQNPPPNVTYIEIEGAYERFAQEEFMTDVGQSDPIGMISEMKSFTVAFCDHVLRSDGFAQLQAYPDEFQVDVILNDYLFGSCLSGYAQYKFGRPPYIGLTAYSAQVTTLTMTGAFSFPSLVPHHMWDAPVPLNFRQRFLNLIFYVYEEISKYSQVLPAQNLILKRLVPDIPNLSELERDTRLVLLNSHPTIQIAEPMMPNVIPVGGMHIRSAKTLPEDLEQWVTRSTRPIALFSLGTNFRSDKLDASVIENLLAAMRELSEFQFLWKFESDLLDYDVPENVYIRQWIPQGDLLANPKVQLFITHSGLLSTQEAIWHGVPIIGFPIFADQFANIEYCVRQGLAKRLLIRKFESQHLIDAVREISSETSYQDNMTKLSKVFRDQPESPLDRAVWWIEWVLRNPDTRVLQSGAIDLHWFVKYSMDVITVIVLAMVTVVLLECLIVPVAAKWRRKRLLKEKKE
ncbi:UDP-glucosyltransferase 2-like [Wyeomyia smithii]|uniref:UDP-glucosyltransferase 2-like n=1 Tax=Wyeomyia smithii TaxID=174621 RepID=UPI002467F44A|nr:UDP-glucosyltransferase 2-like [Wyeomyia smithii]